VRDTISFVVVRLGRALTQLRYLPRALSLAWTSARAWTVVWMALLFVQGLLPVVIVYLTRTLVDALVAAVEAGSSWEAARTPVLLALLMAVLVLLSEVLRAVTRWVRAAQSELVKDHISSLIHDRAVVADLAYYETPDYHDQLYRARADAQHRPVALIESLGGLLQNGITLVAMAVVLFRFGWWVPVALLVSTIPALFVVVRYAIRVHEWVVRTTAERRRALYYDWLVTCREAAAELRLFRLGHHFSGLYQGIRAKIRHEQLDLARAEAGAEVAAGGFALVLAAAALGWMVLRTVQGAITLGELAMFYQAFTQGQRLLRTLLETVGQLYSNVLFLENLFEFLGLEPRVTSPEKPQPAAETINRGIVFRDVTFRYPSSSSPVLQGFNLEIAAGSVVAMLGANGAGKSTLFKLLCRLYDPETGQVEIDGCDIRSFRLEDLRRLITVLFQEPVRYSESLRRNVELGDLDRADVATRVGPAIDAAGAGGIVDRLPRGLDHLLGTWFSGGAEISLGEWQRVALSRAFLRDAPIVLLDEPTSAMDSWAEADWMLRFRRFAEGRTAIVITHRLSTAMIADTIHVMERGRIVESGAHRELIAASGPYARAWAAHGLGGSQPGSSG